MLVYSLLMNNIFWKQQFLSHTHRMHKMSFLLLDHTLVALTHLILLLCTVHMIMLFHNKITRMGQQKWNNRLSVCLSGGRLTVTSPHSPGSLFPVGETVVQYTATDAAGNSRTCNLTVTVQGIRAPLHLRDVPAPQGTLSLFSFILCDENEIHSK